MKPNIFEHDSLELLSKRLAAYVCDYAKQCVARSGIFSLVVSGGKTPERLYELLGCSPYKENMPWATTHIFWSDERMVPRSHPESNYGLIFKTILCKIDIPSTNVHAVPVELGDANKAACVYEMDIRRYFATHPEIEMQSLLEVAPFDMLLLGIGPDGHTASLFPNTPQLKEQKALVAASTAPQPFKVTDRITLTLPVINSGRQVVFMVSGIEKRKIAQRIMSGEGEWKCYPAAMVEPLGKLVWFLG